MTDSAQCGCEWTPGIDLPTAECAKHAADPTLAHRTESAQWRSHDAPFGHCAGCGQDLPVSTGGDGDVIMSLGHCAACGLTTAWSPVNLVTESVPPEEVV